MIWHIYQWQRNPSPTAGKRLKCEQRVFSLGVYLGSFNAQKKIYICFENTHINIQNNLSPFLNILYF